MRFTQVICHGDETQASDVGIVAGLMELLLGCVISGEAFCSLWQENSGQTKCACQRGWDLSHAGCVKSIRAYLLTNFRRFEGGQLEAPLQLCQRGDGNQVLEKGIRQNVTNTNK
jgi:hypothetical protein